MLKKVFQHHAVSKNTTICPGLPSVHVKARHCCNSNDYMAAFKQSLRALSLKKQRMRSKAFTLFHIGKCFDKLEFASVQASLCPISELSQLDWIWMVSNQPNPLIAFLKKNLYESSNLFVLQSRIVMSRLNKISICFRAVCPSRGERVGTTHTCTSSRRYRLQYCMKQCRRPAGQSALGLGAAKQSRSSATQYFKMPGRRAHEWMKWNQIKWNEMKWNEWKNERMNEMKWNEIKSNEMKWNETKWNEMKRNEMKRNERKRNERKGKERRGKERKGEERKGNKRKRNEKKEWMEWNEMKWIKYL